MKATSTKEDFLIWLLKHDSQWAFDNLYRMYAHRLFAFALEYCHHKETAEEIVEDTFIWIWNHRHDIKQEKTLFNLVFIKARHLLIKEIAAMLGLKEQSTRNQLSLGLKQLMTFIGRSGYGMLPVLLLIH